MSSGLSALMRSPALKLLLVAVPFFLNLGGSALWDSSEAFYGETAREMLERSDYVLPTFNYELRTQKPPLTYWCVAASYRLFGISEFSTRLPSALAACLLFAALVWLLRPSASAGSGVGPEGAVDKVAAGPWSVVLLAVSILATTPRFFIVARRLPIDCFLTVFLSIGLILLYRGLCGSAAETLADEAAAGSSPHRQWYWAGAGIFLGFAFLTKGPIAPLLAALICGVFAWIEKLRPKWTSLLLLAAAFLATTVPYYWILFDRGGKEILYNFLVEENLGRYTILDFGPLRGVVYYLRVLLIDAFPWSWFLPAALWLSGSWQPTERRLMRFCWIWFGVVVLFFSFSKNKQEYYILPAYVAMAIVLGHFFPALQLRQAAGRVMRATTLALAAALIAVGGILLWLTRFLPIETPSFGILILLGVGAVVLVLFSSRQRPQVAAGLLAASLLGVVALVCVRLLPALESVRPTRRLTAELARRWRPGDRAGYYRYTSPSMSFYLRSRILEFYHLDRIQTELEHSGRCFFLLRSDEFDRLPPGIRERFEILDSAPELRTRGKEILKLRPINPLPRVLLVGERIG